MPPLDVLERRMANDEQDRRPAAAKTSYPVGGRDRAGPIWRDGAFWRDSWVKAQSGEQLSDAPAILPKKTWLAERDRLGGRSVPLGLLVAAGESVDDLAGDLPRFGLNGRDFPQFSDGKAISPARPLHGN